MLFARKPNGQAPEPAGRRVYAIGDIHGRSDLLKPLLASIRADAFSGEAPADGRPALVLIGDYVDRGPDSKGVVDLVLEVVADDRFEVHPLKGNHEEALLQFLADPGFGPTWADYGGLQTLASYGVDPPRLRSRPEQWQAARDAFAASLPPAHLSFYASLELTVSFGDYAFVHAGVRPGTPLEAQSERDLLWIRDDFLRADAPLADRVVVHGHTPAPEPHLGARRIGIDTGAYATGVLTALRLSGAERTILQARSPGQAAMARATSAAR